jgi:hypothetical protein
VRNILAGSWLFFLTAACFTWLVVMELGIFGYFPGLSDPDTILNVVFIFLFSTTALLGFAFIAAMAKDIEARN